MRSEFLTGKSIQTSSPYRLWVATVGGWLANLVNPVQMSSKVEDAKQQMMKAGLPQDAVIFIAAHSLGGETYFDICDT